VGNLISKGAVNLEERKYPKPVPSLRHLFALLLVLALIRGLIYAVVVPLWHAADEVNHAEYVMFILRERRLPQPGDAVPELRRDLLASLVESDVSASQRGFTGGDLLSDAPPAIPGPSEFLHPPTYYLIEALALWPLAHHDVMTQAYVARIVSMLIGMATLRMVILSARLLFSEQPWLMLGIPLLVLFIPAHTFTNSTINNDQLAELVMSVFFYLWLLIFKSGLSAGRIVGVIIITLIGLFTKRTTAISVPLSLVALLILASRRLENVKRWHWWSICLGLTIGVVCLGAAILHPGAVAGWYASSAKGASLSSFKAKSGEHSMHLSLGPGRESISIYQVLPPQTVEALQGEEVSFGVWINGDKDAVVLLQISDGSHNYREVAEVTANWQFHKVSGFIDPNASELLVTVVVYGTQSADAYCDDMFLRKTNGDGENYLYNGSAERATWRLRPWVTDLLSKHQLLRLDPNIVQAVLDVEGSWPFRSILADSADNLFKLFWAVFGVREVYVSPLWYRILVITHLVSAAGLVLAWIRGHQRKNMVTRWQVESLCFCLIALIVTATVALIRGYPLGSMRFVPAGRYLYVAIVPYAISFVVGIASWIPRRYHPLALIVGAIALFCFDSLCLIYYIIPQWYI